MYHVFRALLFNFGEDLSFYTLRYKLRDWIKIHDDLVNDSIEGDFQNLALLLFQIGRNSLVEYKWLWLYTTCKSLLGLSFMIDNQKV